ncbi:MAG: TIGR04348 family glycosyltransferase [Herminiimonas sp.]|nr:TIGR04348 family glycosyltransferase [Herminiimonas sp.]
MIKPKLIIISPALAKANNGNWQTARRWAHFLRAGYRVNCRSDWPGSDGSDHTDLPQAMIALHARRSAPAIAAFAERCPGRPLVLVLTGTDLYRDIDHDPAAQRSLQLATRLVVLQAAGLERLDTALRAKASVIYQSASPLLPYRPATTPRHLDVIMIGHLREEKVPDTFMLAAMLVRVPRVRLLHVGAALDPALGALAVRTAAATPRYRWLGALPHAQTRQRLKRCALMVISSRMEGGANVIIEAVTCGVPVLASDIAGNRGMLGDDYQGYFPVGDSQALAMLIDRVACDPAFHATLQRQCAARAPLFAPVRENTAVCELMDNCELY